MIGLTKRQAACLAFIKQYISDHGGVPPSYAEMGTHLGLKSKNSIHRVLGCLEVRGVIRRQPFRARSIEIIDPSREPLWFLPADVLETVRFTALHKSMTAEDLISVIVSAWAGRATKPDAWGRQPSHPLFQVAPAS